MRSNMLHRAVRGALMSGLTCALAACGGGSSGDAATPPVTSQVSMPLTISDASSDDWATIGVRVLNIALLPQSGGDPVTVWSASSPAPYVNLEQLDELGEILGNASAPVGTYSGAVLTIGANPADVLLTVAENPESGFPATPGSDIPADQIQIQGKQGSSGNFTVPVKIAFAQPLSVAAGQSNALDLEFDLANPAFIVGHTPPAAMGETLWAVNFKGPVRHRAMRDVTRLVLRHSYGTVGSVAADNSSFTMMKDFAALPVTSPETAVATSIALTIAADAANGTIFYDIDAKSRSVLKDFSLQAASLTGKFVRVAARYQQDGSLVAVRVWASSEFSNVWSSPEGHVLHVDAANNIIRVASESGSATSVTVDANTQFFFRTPQNAQADATPIATGTEFLADQDLVRGFKVHVSVVDPLATPLVAQSIDIETATYAGRISASDASGFTYARDFARASDDYSRRLDYVDAGTANGSDAGGAPLTGFKWWNFSYPTQVTSGANAVPAFVAATGGGANFGGTVGTLVAWGVSSALWADPANPGGWSLRDAVLLPTPVPLGAVTTAFSGSTFGMSVPGGTMAVSVAVGTQSQSATLVYQIDRAGGVVTISPIDITTSTGLASLTSGLAAGVPVKVFGIPQGDGALRAYVIAYYTGTPPSM